MSRHEHDKEVLSALETESVVEPNGDVEDFVRHPDETSHGGSVPTPVPITEDPIVASVSQEGASPPIHTTQDVVEQETIAAPVAMTAPATIEAIGVPAKGREKVDPNSNQAEITFHECGLYDCMVNPSYPLKGKRAIAHYFRMHNVDVMVIAQTVQPGEPERRAWTTYRNAVGDALSVSVHMFTAALWMIQKAKLPYRTPTSFDLASLGQSEMF